jgi:hypothetical protein
LAPGPQIGNYQTPYSQEQLAAALQQPGIPEAPGYEWPDPADYAMMPKIKPGAFGYTGGTGGTGGGGLGGGALSGTFLGQGGSGGMTRDTFGDYDPPSRDYNDVFGGYGPGDEMGADGYY